jgi:tRNA pseudouridine55 synthase
VHGVLLVDKPRGPSSAGLSRALGRKLGADRVGHGGTLDPMASGLLVVCLGEATKIAGYLLDADKEYEAELTFGVETDTLDAEGRETARHDASELDEARVRAALEGVEGPQRQVPPMYAAIKQDGKKLYELARQGVEVERAPRDVVFHSIRLDSFARADGSVRARVTVACSKGTYIRALARDVGDVLGCGAHLSALRRTRTAGLSVADAMSPDAIESAFRAGQPLPLRSPAVAVGHLPRVEIPAGLLVRVRQGQQSALAGLVPGEPGPIALVDPDGALVAVGEATAGGGIKLLRVLLASSVDPGLER